MDRPTRVLLSLIATASGLAVCCAALRADEETRLILTRAASSAVTIDGDIEDVWAEAESVLVDFQLQPYFGRPPQHRTVARLLADREALYCLIISYDDPADVQSYAGLVDLANGDAVSLMIDTFNDRQTAYKFAVTASGVRADARMLDDARNRDYSWDGIWWAASRVHEWGYAVEMKIPYKSIRYGNDTGEWGVDFDRWVSDTKEDLYWMPYEQNEGQRVSKFGRLRFDGVRPEETGLNLELYPVAFTSASYRPDGSYLTDAEVGGDVFYNPSEQLTFQLTANPDFAQIEADPYTFNVSRYESYFDERRPFFTTGNEVFMASGRQRNTGFYRPLELFYSRRIGRALPDGNAVPITFGAKATGRLEAWEYGGFAARTAETPYTADSENPVEPRALFTSVRVKRQILDNSSAGVLLVAKTTPTDTYGVIDIDGAFRGADWQLSYQIARSFVNDRGDFGGSAGYVQIGEHWINFVRTRVIGNNFDVQQVGFVPWRGTAHMTAISGPIWYPKEGWVSQVLLYGGFSTNYEHVDLYTDWDVVLGYNMGFRDNWGFEVNVIPGRRRDAGVTYAAFDVAFSSWFNISPRWQGNLYMEFQRTYNFQREYLGNVLAASAEVEWLLTNTFQVGTTLGRYAEYTPQGSVEEITCNARPFVSVTPFNNLNLRLYVDNTWLRSSGHIEQVVGGLLFSYNFLPKSWIYLALNDIQERTDATDGAGRTVRSAMHVQARVAVFKVRYLYYL